MIIPFVLNTINRAMAHNPKKYPEPESFHPDRFLNPDGTLNDDTVPWVFGFGRRRWYALLPYIAFGPF